MEAFIKKIKNYIVKDVENDNETKRASVIMRAFSLVMCAYFLLMSIILGSNAAWNGSVVNLFFLLGYVLAFFFTYRNHTTGALCYLILATLLWTGLDIALFGWDCGVQQFLLVLLLVCFTASHDSALRKGCMAGALCLVRFALFFYARGHEPMIRVEEGVMVAMQIVNSIVIYLEFAILLILFSQDSLAMEKKLMSYNEKLRELSRRDPLTKLYNRRAMFEYLEKQVERAEGYGEWFDIAIGDIDFFKKVNDTYGHEAGDEVLRHIAGQLSAYMAGKGRICRWGGEEFLLVFENMNGEVAQKHLEEIRRMIEQAPTYYKETRISVTMTFGLDEYINNKPIDETIISADHKLYMGKEQGRNRVVF